MSHVNEFFSGALRANLPRDDTCTVLAEFGNEYTDNGFERYVEREKRRILRTERLHPAWRGGAAVSRPELGIGALYQPINASASVLAGHDTASVRGGPRGATRPASAHLVSLLMHEQKRLLAGGGGGDGQQYGASDAELNAIVHDRRVLEAADKYRKAQAVRELFERQRDKDAHLRDLEHVMDRRDIAYLPDGTKICRDGGRAFSQQQRDAADAAGSAARKRSPKRSGAADDNGNALLKRVGSLRSLGRKIPPQQLSTADQLLLQDFFQPSSSADADDMTAQYRQAKASAAGATATNNDHARRSRGEGFYCNVADDLGCPIDASVGTVGVFRQIRRWKRFVPDPERTKFSSKAMEWPLRLHLPLQQDECSFEGLVAAHLADQQRQRAIEDEQRNRLSSASARSTPTFFEGDGPNAYCLRPGGAAAFAAASMSQQRQRQQQQRRGSAGALPQMKEDYGFFGADEDYSASPSAPRRGVNFGETPEHQADVASPVIGLPQHAHSQMQQQQRQQQQQRVPQPPTSSRPQSARVATGASAAAAPPPPLLHTQSMRFGLGEHVDQKKKPTPAAMTARLQATALRRNVKVKEKFHGEGWSDDDSSSAPDEDANSVSARRRNASTSASPRGRRTTPSAPPPQFRTVEGDPRFAKHAARSVGQRMMMMQGETLLADIRPRQTAAATTAFLRGPQQSPR